MRAILLPDKMCRSRACMQVRLSEGYQTYIECRHAALDGEDGEDDKEVTRLQSCQFVSNA